MTARKHRELKRRNGEKMAGRILTFILSVLFTLYMSVLYNSNGFLFVFYAEILIGSILFITDIILFFRLKIKLETEPVINRYGRINFELVLENRSILPSGKILITLCCLDPYNMKQKKVVIKKWCQAKSTERHSYSFRDDEILSGNYVVSVKKAGIYDYLGFFKLNRHMKNKSEAVCVVPVTDENYIQNAEKEHDNDENCIMVNEKNENNGDFSHVREYRNGDRLRNIHWKLSSKSNTLYVKEFLDDSKNCYYYYIETKPLKREEIAREFDKWNRAGFGAIENGENIVYVWYDARQKQVKKAYVSNEEELYRALCEINVYDELNLRSAGKNPVIDKETLIEMERTG